MRDDYPKEWEAIVDSGPERIDRWLHKNLAGFSMSAVREMIRAGKVRVNGRRVKKGRRVEPEDMVTVSGVPERPWPLADENLELDVVYEDEVLAVVDKPSGVPSHPLSPAESGALVNAAVARWPDLRGVGGRELEPGLLHRLDTGTCGLVMFLRNREAFEFMRREMKMHRMKKIYRALVSGEARSPKGEIRIPLARHPSRTGLMVPALEGIKYRGRPMEALTRYRVLETGRGATLVELDLVTGVMHQLRVHLAHIGHPVLGDDHYGDRPDPSSKAFALQAARLSFMHPRSKAQVEVKAGRLLSMHDFFNPGQES